MLVPKKVRLAVYSYLFKEGVLVAAKDVRPNAKHNEIDVPNLYVLKLLLSLKSRGFVREQFTWNHFYYFLTNTGIEYLREFLHLPQEIVPATLKRKPGQPTGERPQGERPAGAGRGFRSRPAGKEGAASDFKPSFEGAKTGDATANAEGDI